MLKQYLCRSREITVFSRKRRSLDRKVSLHGAFGSIKAFLGLEQLVKSVETAAFSNNLLQFFTILEDRPDHMWLLRFHVVDSIFNEVGISKCSR